MMPAVTVMPTASGSPMAMTESPGRIFALSPHLIAGRGRPALIFTSTMSMGEI